MSDQHDRFLKRLAASRHAMFVVAEWQHAKGYTVEIPKLRFAPTAADHQDYVDDGDLFVLVRHRWEVKYLGVRFTGRGDWPFGNRVYVDTVRSVKRAKGEVIAYVSVSEDFRALAIVPGETHQHWYAVKTPNKNTGNIDETYVCPIDYVHFDLIG